MINGITKEFGEVIFDGARVPAANMIGEPGEGWRLAMTVVSHEREPGELGYVARYRKIGQRARRRGAAPTPTASTPSSAATWRGRSSSPRCCGCTCAAGCPIASTASSTGPTGSIDKLLMTEVEQAVGHAALSIGGTGHGGDDTWMKMYLYSRAQSVMGGTSQIQRNLDRHTDPGAAHIMTLRPSRPSSRSSSTGRSGSSASTGPSSSTPPTTSCTRAWPSSAPRSTPTPRCAPSVLTGNGRAFSAGGDFNYLDELVQGSRPAPARRWSTVGRS